MRPGESPSLTTSVTIPAIRETMRALRVRFPVQKIWAIFEPRTNTTRRKIFQNEILEALSMADGIAVAQVARLDQLDPGDRLDPEQIIESLRAEGRPAFYLPDSRFHCGENW